MGRQKPNKPRRDSTKGVHRHPGLSLDAGPHPDGWKADRALLEAVTGAALARCTSCQGVTLTLLVEDSVTCARLVELACEAITKREGSLPHNQTDPDASGYASLAFRRLARASQDVTAHRMYQECEQMTVHERRAAANTALDTLVGYAALPQGLLTRLRHATADPR